MSERTVKVKLQAEHAAYDAAMRSSGDSTEKLGEKMSVASAAGRRLAQAEQSARTAALTLAAASRDAASAQSKSAEAAKKAAVAEAAAAVANEDAAQAAQKAEHGELSKTAALKLAREAARKDAEAETANAAANELAAKAAEKLERASLKAAAAQLAQGRAASLRSSKGGASAGGIKGTIDNAIKSLAGDALKAGEEAGSLFGQGFSGAVKTIASLPPEVSIPIIVVGATVATAALTEISAAVGGAILGGVGIVGFGAAIAAQINDPAVKAALSGLKADAQATLKTSSASFVQPIQDGAAIIDHMLSNISPDLKHIFDSLAPSFNQFVQGVAGMVENIMPGLIDAADAAAPIFNSLARELPQLGSSISDFFSDISTSGQGAAEGLNVVFEVIKVGMSIIGNTIGGAEAIMNNFFNDLAFGVNLISKIPGAKDAIAPLIAGLNAVGGTSGVAARGVADYGSAADQAGGASVNLTTNLKAANDQFNTMVNNALGARDADLQFKAALLGIADAARQNGTSLDENTAKGNANAQMFDQLINDAIRAKDANIQNGMSVAEASKKFDQQVESIRRQAAAAGFSKSQIDALLRSLGILPGRKEINISAPGAAGTNATLQSIHYWLDSLHDKQFTVTTYYRTSGGGQMARGSSSIGGGGRAEADGGILDSYASGGFHDPSHIASIVPGGTMRLMAEPETGGEAYIPLSPAKRARSGQVWRETGKRLGMPVSEVAGRGPSGPSAADIAQAVAQHLDTPLRDVADALAAAKTTTVQLDKLQLGRAIEQATKYRGRT